VTTDDLLRLGVAFVAIVGGCGVAGRFLAGFIAMLLGKDEDLWMRKGEIMFGCVGLGGWIGVVIGTLSH
jgi:hypothetical protein